MAFVQSTSIVVYTAASGQTVFQFPFKYFEDSDILVYLRPAVLVGEPDYLLDPSKYTITPVGANIGGSITLNTGATLDDTIVIQRSLPAKRTVEYSKRGDLLASTLNDDQDYQTYILQDVVDKLKLAIFLAPGSGNGVEFPPPSPNGYILYNETGTALITDDTVPEGVIAAELAAAASEASATASATSAGESAGSADDSYVTSRDSEAEALTSDSYAMQAPDEPVITYAYNPVTDEIDETITPDRSSYHWSEQAKLAASGLTPLGLLAFNTDTCVYNILESGGSLGPVPPTPPVLLPGDTNANGYMYIVSRIDGSGSGGCDQVSLKDWYVWSGDDDTAPVIGGWTTVHATTDWNAIVGTPENVWNALSRSGGTMTDQIKGIAPVAAEDLTRKDYVDTNFAFQGYIDDSVDSIIKNGVYSVRTTDGIPLGANGVGDGIIHTDFDANAKSQLYMAYAQGTTYRRTGGTGGAWEPWKELASFDPATGGFLPLIGGTMTGTTILAGETQSAGLQFKIANGSFFNYDYYGNDLRHYASPLGVGALTISNTDINTQQVTFAKAPRSEVSPIDISDLTRKDYVDTRFVGTKGEFGTSVDFNSYTANAIYRQPSNTANTHTNGPINLPQNARYMLVVFASAGSLTQVIYGQDGGAEGKTWTRNIQDTTYFAWQEFTNSARLVGSETSGTETRIPSMVRMTQANYDLITPVADTMYVIVG